MEKVIIGAGGFAREIKSALGLNDIKFFVDDLFIDEKNNIFGLSNLDIEKHIAIIAIGSPEEREKIKKRLPNNLEYFTYIDRRAIILDKNINIGKGSIICAGAVLTTNIKNEEHVIINLNVTIGHDTRINDFTTVSPGANISGNCLIGKKNYIGSNSCIREGISLCDNVIVGLNGAVTANIQESGIYIGIPAKIKG